MKKHLKVFSRPSARGDVLSPREFGFTVLVRGTVLPSIFYHPDEHDFGLLFLYLCIPVSKLSLFHETKFHFSYQHNN